MLLIAVLATYIGYGRYRALKAYRQIIARSGVSLTHDSNGVTYSQSIKGRKVFTIRAKTESSLGDGKYALHNADLTLYNRTTGAPGDHIYGSEMEYDENQGIARAKGDVFMDIQPPEGLTNGGRTQTQPTKPRPATAPVIHVRTSGLVYLRKLGIASTDQQVDFSYGGMQCTSLGAEFNSDQNTLHLLANVHMDGLAHGKPLHLVATRADLDRNENVANLTGPVVNSDGRTMKADVALLHLRKDGSIERVQGTNHVVLTSKTQTVTSNRLDATLNLQSIPQTAKLTGNVVLVDTDPLKPTHGSANFADIAFDSQGSPTSVIATGAAKLYRIDRASDPQGLARSLDGEKIVALFEPGQHKSPSHITRLHVTGSAHASGESIAAAAKGAQANKTAQRKNVQVWADDLQVLFADAANGKAQAEKLYGNGHTKLQQDAPLGEQEISSGDKLEVAFNSAPASPSPEKAVMNISSAVQIGDVTIYDRAAGKPTSSEPGAVSTGTADHAAYDGSSQVLTLTGSAHLYGENGSLIAPIVTLDQRTQDADAKGGVQANFQNASQQQSTGATATSAGKPAPVTHVLSSTAHFDHALRLANFYGTDAQPARMWQDASQVQAATLLFDGIHRTLSARPIKLESLIHAIFASTPSQPKQGSSKAPGILRVASPKMDYNDLQREATFSGGVTLDGTMGEVRGQRAVVFLTAANKPPASKLPVPAPQAQPNPLNGSIDRGIVYGDVQIDQPGRHGSGEQLLYTASTGDYVLTGTPAIPPRIVDAQQGNVTGTTLLFGDAGSTIVVAGNPGAPKGKGGRVRTETHVNSAKEERP
jgi:lipopolysaccharide export system protein LptA